MSSSAMLLDREPAFAGRRVRARAAAASPNSVAVWFMLSIPLVWLLGLAPLAGIMFAAIFLRYRSRLRAPELALLGVGAACLVSLALAGGNGEAPDRIVAAAYNLVVLICACIALNFGRQVDFNFARTTGLRTVCVAFFFAYAAAIAAAFFVSMGSAEPHGFLSLVTGHLVADEPGLIGSYAEARISAPDWASGSAVPRPLAFGVYFNEGALMFLCAGIVALVASRSRIVKLAIALCIIVGMIVLGSRMLLLAMLVAAVLALLARIPATREVRLLIAAVGLVGAIGAIAISPQFLNSAAQQVVESRESSSATRFMSYSIAVEQTWRDSPLIGQGIKPRDDSLLPIPIGSHSSIVSIFTKGGVLALIPLLFFFGYIAVSGVRLLFLDHSAPAYRGAQAALGAAAFIVLAWMLVQDFDAPIYGTMLGFAFLGSGLGLLDRLLKVPAEQARSRERHVEFLP